MTNRLDRTFSRRSLLGGFSVAAVAAAGLAGCRSGGGSTDGASASAGLTLPTYQEPSGVAADLPGSTAGLEPGYLRMPDTFAATTDGSPLSARVTGLTETFATPSPAMADNPYWQRLNAKLGGDLDLIIAQDIGGGYPERFATILASDDLPDMMWIPPNQGIPNVGPMLEAKFADLTEYLTGDAVLEYPNLAALKPASWKTAVVNGAIWGAPIPSTPMGQCMIGNPTVWESVGGFQCESAQEFFDKCTEISTGNRYALEPAYINMVHMIGEWYGVPNRWAVADDGALTYYLETEEYKASIEFAARLFEAGCFHPNSSLPDAAAQVAQGQLGAFVSSNPDVGALRPFNAEQQADVLIPFGWDGQATPVYDMGYGTVGYTAFKQADEGTLRTLLSLINWLSAPFGTQEWVDKQYGTEGEDWTRDSATGDLIPTESAQTNAPGLVSALTIMSSCEGIIYHAGRPEDTERKHEIEQQLLEIAQPIPTAGTYSDSDARVGAKIQSEARDAMVDIVTGRASIDGWDDAVTRWRNGGGDDIRAEYEAALAGA